MNCNPTIPVQNVEGKTVYMGVFTTFNARSVTFDFSAWVDSLGEGTFSVSLLRPGDTTPYAVAGLSIDGTLATWVFDATDTALAGYGRAFLSYVTADAMDMTVDFDVYIAQNSAPSGDTPPDPLETWYQQMLEAAAQAQMAAQNAEASSSAAAESESTVEGYKNAAEAAAQNAAASQALADQYAAAAALARQAAETAAAAAASAKTSAEAAQASAIAAAQAAAADKLAADASAAAAAAAKEAALAAQAAAAASAAAAAGSEQSVADNAAAAIAARDAALAAQSAAQAASSAAASSAQAAASSATAARSAAESAAQSASTASTAANNAGASATLAQSWAVGGTGTRTGEEEDNAQYYAEQAGDSANKAEMAAEMFPPGGTVGQVLQKKSNADFDTEWAQPMGLLDSVRWRPPKNFGKQINGVAGDNIKVYRDWADEILVFVGAGEMYRGTKLNDPYLVECVCGYGNRTVKEIYVQEGITSIGSHVFNRFYSADLSYATFHSWLDVVSRNANDDRLGFARRTIVLPATITTVGMRSFQYWKANANILNILSTGDLVIGNDAFQSANFYEINIPNATTITGYNSLTFSLGLLRFFSVGGTLEDSISFISTLLDNNSLINIANHLKFVLGTEESRTITLPDALKTKLATIMGTVSDGQFSSSSTGDVSLQDFITNTRGWSIA